MPALIDLRRRIRSVRNTQQITKAMKTVSTAKFKKAQRIVLGKRPYWQSYLDLLEKVVSWAERNCRLLLEERKENKMEAVVMASDKGLCGAFNANLLEEAFSFFEKKAHEEVRLVLIGRKVMSFFKNKSFPVDRKYMGNVDELTGEELKDLAQYLMKLYVFNRTDAVYIICNKFKSILAPKIIIKRLIPIEPSEMLEDKEGDEEQLLPDWEPGKEILLDSLLPFYVENQIRRLFMESLAAEHAARMMAMDSATRNAEDLIEELTKVLNKVRQASITKELLEIMTAVDALSKK